MLKTFRAAVKKIFFFFQYSRRKRLWRNEFIQERIKEYESTRIVNLGFDNIRNLQVVLNRDELLEKLPKNKIVAEIGVDSGEYSKLIFKTCIPAKLHLVDSWQDGDRYHRGLKEGIDSSFSTEIAVSTVKIDVGFSTEILSSFPDKYFDWVYLDTDHSYNTTKAELYILKRKLKTGGIIAGHDYTLGNWVQNYRYGVIEAVNEFCVDNAWEFIFITMETHQYRSYAIREIRSNETTPHS